MGVSHGARPWGRTPLRMYIHPAGLPMGGARIQLADGLVFFWARVTCFSLQMRQVANSIYEQHIIRISNQSGDTLLDLNATRLLQ